MEPKGGPETCQENPKGAPRVPREGPKTPRRDPQEPLSQQHLDSPGHRFWMGWLVGVREVSRCGDAASAGASAVATRMSHSLSYVQVQCLKRPSPHKDNTIMIPQTCL
eukprot:9483571-Pyramimonas_sp.AAC.1